MGDVGAMVEEMVTDAKEMKENNEHIEALKKFDEA
jgi:hypothetical protein